MMQIQLDDFTRGSEGKIIDIKKLRKAHNELIIVENNLVAMDPKKMISKLNEIFERCSGVQTLMGPIENIRKNAGLFKQTHKFKTEEYAKKMHLLVEFGNAIYQYIRK